MKEIRLFSHKEARLSRECPILSEKIKIDGDTFEKRSALPHKTKKGTGTTVKTITDIRLFISEVENKDGNPLPTYLDFENRKSLAIIQRIVMKLRENGFSLGEFDHLYLNFTTCPVENDMAISKRKVDPYHPWYRYYEVHVDEALFHQLHLEMSFGIVIKSLEKLLITFFATEAFDHQHISDCFTEALTKGETMMMKFKEKTTAKRKAIIFLRYTDNLQYLPLLRVLDPDDNILFETALPEMQGFEALGNIRVTLNKVTVEPKKNAFSKDLCPLQFNY